MRYVVAGFIALIKIELANIFQYRIVMFLYALWEVVNPVIYLIVWSTVAGDGRIAGFSRDDFVMYYLVFMVVAHLTQAIEVYTFGPLIEQGKLSPRLLRPIHPSWAAAATNIAYKTVSLIMLGPVWIAAFLIMRPSFGGDWGHNRALCAGDFRGDPSIVPYRLAVRDAGVLDDALIFVLGNLGGIAFASRRADRPRLPFCPGFVRDLAIALPPRYTLGFPVEVVLGRLDAAELAVGFAVQGAWIAAAAMSFVIVWRSGIKRYSAVGA